jgi:hypothetical protein
MHNIEAVVIDSSYISSPAHKFLNQLLVPIERSIMNNGVPLTIPSLLIYPTRYLLPDFSLNSLVLVCPLRDLAAPVPDLQQPLLIISDQELDIWEGVPASGQREVQKGIAVIVKDGVEGRRLEGAQRAQQGFELTQILIKEGIEEVIL